MESAVLGELNNADMNQTESNILDHMPGLEDDTPVVQDKNECELTIIAPVLSYIVFGVGLSVIHISVASCRIIGRISGKL